MMAGFDAHPAIRATFDEASAVLRQDLWALVTSGRKPISTRRSTRSR
jgi:hypothetical protein